MHARRGLQNERRAYPMRRRLVGRVSNYTSGDSGTGMLEDAGGTRAGAHPPSAASYREVAHAHAGPAPRSALRARPPRDPSRGGRCRSSRPTSKLELKEVSMCDLPCPHRPRALSTRSSRRTRALLPPSPARAVLTSSLLSLLLSSRCRVRRRRSRTQGGVERAAAPFTAVLGDALPNVPDMPHAARPVLRQCHARNDRSRLKVRAAWALCWFLGADSMGACSQTTDVWPGALPV